MKQVCFDELDFEIVIFPIAKSFQKALHKMQLLRRLSEVKLDLWI